MNDHRAVLTAVFGAVARGTDSRNRLGRQGAPAVDPEHQILDSGPPISGLHHARGVFRRSFCHHWTSAVSIVEPGPIVIRTP